MKTFGTLEYAIDKYSGSWTWKITGVRAVMMVSKLIPELWYGRVLTRLLFLIMKRMLNKSDLFWKDIH